MSTYQRGLVGANQAPRGLGVGPLLPRIAASTPSQGQQVMGGENLGLAEQAAAGRGVSGPDSLGIGLMQRGMANRATEALARMQASQAQTEELPDYLPNNPGSSFMQTQFDPTQVQQAATRGGYLPDPMWEGLKQAFHERGVDRIRTGAARGWDKPGFYDMQAPGGIDVVKERELEAKASPTPAQALEGLLKAPPASRTLQPTNDPYASDVRGSSEAWINEQRRMLKLPSSTFGR